MSKTLLMIPDISGFTDFVNRTEIMHSQHIISELLEIIILEQNLKMEIAEIEGDAVLFYREDFIPAIELLLKQTEKMFLRFHRHLRLYEKSRICHCGACTSATNLSLKFVVHQCEIGFTLVNNKKKPFGPGLVTAHRILKNSITSDEYLLLTDECYRNTTTVDQGSENSNLFQEGFDTYNSIGVVRYRFIDYAHLKKKVDQVESPAPAIHSGNRVWYEGNIGLPINQVFDVVSTLKYRIQWLEDLEKMTYKKDRVNRIGTRHVCVYSGSSIEFETIAGSVEHDKMIYGEKMENVFFNREVKFFYVLEKRGNRTAIKMEMHFFPENILGFIFLPVIKYKARKDLRKNLEGLKKYCENTYDPSSQY